MSGKGENQGENQDRDVGVYELDCYRIIIMPCNLMDHLNSPLLAGYCRPLCTNLHYSLGDTVLFTVNIFINQLLQQYQSIIKRKIVALSEDFKD